MRLLSAVLLAVFVASPLSAAQEPSRSGPEQREDAAACDQYRAVFLIQQQADEVRKLGPSREQIAILSRAGELLWPFNETAGRSALEEAFDLAEQRFDQFGDEMRKEDGTSIVLEDQRFRVIQAIARVDPAWARLLTEQISERTRSKADQLGSATSQADPLAKLVSKLMSTAMSVLPENRGFAVSIVRNALRYGVPIQFPQFLYELARFNQQTADQLYEEALAVAAPGSIDQWLYLAPYALRLGNGVGTQTSYVGLPPTEFVPNPRLQYLFLETFFQKAEALLTQNNEILYRTSEPYRVLVALEQLEPLIAQYQPTFLDRADGLKKMLSSVLSPELRKRANETAQRTSSRSEWAIADKYLEEADRQSDSVQRDKYLAMGVLGLLRSRPTDELADLAKRISDSKLRQQVTDYLYFELAQRTAKEGNLDEAWRVAKSVDSISLRASLAYQLAEIALKRTTDRARSMEVLDGVAALAAKAPDSNQKAKIQIGVSDLYSKFDRVRAMAALGNAVVTINRMSDPDLSSNSLFFTIEADGYKMSRGFTVEGLSLEKTFHDMGATDFEGTLMLAKNIEKKTLRATAIIGLSTSCLEDASRAAKPSRPKRGATPEVSKRAGRQNGNNLRRQ